MLNCSEHEDNDGRIKALQVEFTDMEIAEVTLCHLETVHIAQYVRLERNIVYMLCGSLPYLQQL